MGKPTGRNGREHMSQMGNDRVSNLWQRMLQGSSLRRDTATSMRDARAPQSDDVDPGIKRRLLARQQLRQALNEETLRAFRNADRFTTFKIVRRPGAL